MTKHATMPAIAIAAMVTRATSVMKAMTLVALVIVLARSPAASAHPHDDERTVDELEHEHAGDEGGRDEHADEAAWPSADTADGAGALRGALPGAGPGVPSPVAVADLLAAAYAAANLDRDLSRSWRRRARVAGLVPWVSVRLGWDASWDEQVTNVDRGRVFDVRATWRLDRLVFDGRELQAASVELARRRERRRLAREVVSLYFAWQRAAARRGSTARLDELTAELDALTDGWFSEKQDRARRGASETRTPGR